MNQPSHQRELPLSHQNEIHELPPAVIAECRQLIAQMLREVLQAEKKAKNEH